MDRLRVGVDGDVLIKFKDHPSGTTVGVKHYTPVFHSPAEMSSDHLTLLSMRQTAAN